MDTTEVVIENVTMLTVERMMDNWYKKKLKLETIMETIYPHSILGMVSVNFKLFIDPFTWQNNFML